MAMHTTPNRSCVQRLEPKLKAVKATLDPLSPAERRSCAAEISDMVASGGPMRPKLRLAVRGDLSQEGSGNPGYGPHTLPLNDRSQCICEKAPAPGQGAFPGTGSRYVSRVHKFVTTLQYASQAPGVRGRSQATRRRLVSPDLVCRIALPGLPYGGGKFEAHPYHRRRPGYRGVG